MIFLLLRKQFCSLFLCSFFVNCPVWPWTLSDYKLAVLNVFLFVNNLSHRRMTDSRLFEYDIITLPRLSGSNSWLIFFIGFVLSWNAPANCQNIHLHGAHHVGWSSFKLVHLISSYLPHLLYVSNNCALFTSWFCILASFFLKATCHVSLILSDCTNFWISFFRLKIKLKEMWGEKSVTDFLRYWLVYLTAPNVA